MALDVALVALGAVVVGGLVLLTLPWLYDYRVTNDSIEVLVFRVFPVARFRLDTIEDARRTKWLARELLNPSVLRLGNRIGARCVLVQRRSGLFRRIAFSPADPNAFVRQIRRG